ncbi:NYN domain-containing protein [Bacillota bacterium LX-D]|nr:NYN domain-containing protein [Bacillota bacterium LX-D]
MEDVLIVDGYNVLNGWPELNKVKEESLEHAREKLIDILSEYSALKGVQVIVVFDGQMVKGGIRNAQFISGIEVIYTNEGETADSVIEKLMHQLPSNLLAAVATSDWDEQKIVLGKGAIRMPVRELREQALALEKDVQKFYHVGKQKTDLLEARIENKVRAVLEKWRRQ